MLKFPLSALALSAFFFSASIASAQSAQSAQTIRVFSGGPAAAKKFEKIKAEAEKAAGAKIELNITQFDVAFRAIADKKADGMFSPPIPVALAAAEKAGLKGASPNDFQAFLLIQVSQYYAMHPKNPVQSLTAEQLSGVLSGKTKNWKELGGKDEPVVVVMPKVYVTSMRALTKHYIKADESPVAEYVQNHEGALRSLQSKPNQIIFSNVTDVTPAFAPRWEKTEAKNELHFVTRKDARPEVQKLYDFLKTQQAAFQD